MKLPVFRTVGTTFTFGLRHFPAFYLLCLLTSLPTFVYGLVRGQNDIGEVVVPQRWESDLLTFVELVFSAFVVAVMAWTLIRDRQGESGTVLAALGDTLERAPTILGAGVVFAVGSTLLSVFSDILSQIYPAAAIGLSVGMIFLGLYLAVVLPCAAVDNGGVMDCFSRSIALTQGSRLRILLVYAFVCIPLFIAIFIFVTIMQPRPGEFEQLPFTWVIFGLPALMPFLLTAQVAMHEHLAELNDGVEFSTTAAVFD